MKRVAALQDPVAQSRAGPLRGGGNMAGGQPQGGRDGQGGQHMAFGGMATGGAAAGGIRAGGALAGGAPAAGAPVPGGMLPLGGQVDDDTATVAADGSGDFLDLASALAAGKRDILVRAGRYEVASAIVFDRPDVTVRGENRQTVRFVQTNDDADLFVVRADNVTIAEITLDTSVAGQAAFVESNAHQVTLMDSIINGGDNVFTIFFAGPNVAQGDETLNAFEAGALSRGNRLIGNVINTRFVGDSVSFSLQADGEVRDNILNGGMLAVYVGERDVLQQHSDRFSHEWDFCFTAVNRCAH